MLMIFYIFIIIFPLPGGYLEGVWGSRCGAEGQYNMF